MTNTTYNNEDNFVTTAHPFEGLANGEERLAKTQLARQINVLIKERGLKQQAASDLLGVTQPEVSQIANGRLSGFHLIVYIAVYMHLVWMLKLL